MISKKFFFIVSGIAVLLTLVLVFTFLVGKPFSSIDIDAEREEVSNSSKKENKFESPEDAIEYFVRAIGRNKLEDALKACAVEEISYNLDFYKWCNRLGALIPKELAPTEYKMYQEINTYSNTSEIASQIKFFAYSILTDMDLTELITIENDGQIAEFIESVDPKRLKDLKIIRIDPPVPDILNSDGCIKVFNTQAEVFGAKEATERVVLYDLDGQTYMGGFYLLRYEDGWKISRMYSALTGQSAYGDVEKSSINEYMEVIK